METRSNQVLVGSVVLILLAVTAVFMVWLARLGGGEQKSYDIFFKQSVDGLAQGSAVAFSGVPVGQVTQIVLWKPDPQFVRVRIAVKDEVPIVQGTTATIQGIGFTGVSQIQLDGAIKGAPPITDQGPAGVPVIPTKPGAFGELLNNAPKLLERLSTLTERLTETLSDENQKSITNILKNTDRMTGALAERSGDLKALLAETKVTVHQAGLAAEQVAKLTGTTNDLLDKEGRPLMGDLRKAVMSAQKSMDNLDGAISQARPGIDNFSKRTLPELDLLVRDLRTMSTALTAVAERLDRGGAGSLVGSPKLPDYKPGKTRP